MIDSIEWRLPGCGRDCVPRRHDPIAHEAYGLLLGTMVARMQPWIVRTGPLVIDREQQTVMLGDRLVSLTPREWQILDYLVRTPGRFHQADQIAQEIWGQWHSETVLRTVLDRLRKRLGSAAVLIETRPYRGYRLRIEPPCDPDTLTLAPTPRDWSRQHTQCVCCGQTDLPHHAHGRCRGCSSHRRQGRPCRRVAS